MKALTAVHLMAIDRESFKRTMEQGEIQTMKRKIDELRENDLFSATGSTFLSHFVYFVTSETCSKDKIIAA